MRPTVTSSGLYVSLLLNIYASRSWQIQLVTITNVLLFELPRRVNQFSAFKRLSTQVSNPFKFTKLFSCRKFKIKKSTLVLGCGGWICIKERCDVNSRVAQRDGVPSTCDLRSQVQVICFAVAQHICPSYKQVFSTQ